MFLQFRCENLCARIESGSFYCRSPRYGQQFGAPEVFLGEPVWFCVADREKPQIFSGGN